MIGLPIKLTLCRLADHISAVTAESGIAEIGYESTYAVFDITGYTVVRESTLKKGSLETPFVPRTQAPPALRSARMR